jgi:hypothetical protein
MVGAIEAKREDRIFFYSNSTSIAGAIEAK